VRIEKAIVFEDGDEVALRVLEERCNEARNFFTTEGVRSIEAVVRGGHPVGPGHLKKAVVAVEDALRVLRHGKPHFAFPAELKVRYETNLVCCLAMLEPWLYLVEVRDE
jgi:hypothetical protein